MSINAILGQFAGATVIGSYSALANNGLASLQTLKEILSTPMLNYIPIYTPTLKCSREAVISTSMVMSQVTGKKSFATDNSAPGPRTWSLTGYLRSLMPQLETNMIVYPTILLQKSLLDMSMTSGDTVVFKTKDGEFVDVLIKSLTIEDEQQGENSAKITVTVQEVPYLTALFGALADVTAPVAALSLPMQLQIATIGAAAVMPAMSSIVPAFSPISF